MTRTLAIVAMLAALPEEARAAVADGLRHLLVALEG